MGRLITPAEMPGCGAYPAEAAEVDDIAVGHEQVVASRGPAATIRQNLLDDRTVPTLRRLTSSEPPNSLLVSRGLL
jgi:hypothetical protein